MAPGTRLNQEKIDLNSDDITLNVPQNDSAQNNPWPDAETNAHQTDSFSDSFSDIQEQSSSATTNSFEQNRIYLQHLEAKLARIETKNKSVRKISAKEMINAIAIVKEEQAMNIMGESSTSESSDVDFDTTDLTLTTELRRRMFPEQCAVNRNELLHLIDHDVLQNEKPQ